MRDKYHYFRIMSPDVIGGRGSVIEMDGQPLKGVVRVVVEVDVNDVNKVTLTMLAGSINAALVAEDQVGEVIDDPS